MLSLAATPETFEAISKRIDPQWSEALWRNFGYELAFKGPFKDFLTSSVERECNPPAKRTFPEYRCSPAEATRKLLEQDSSAVIALADRLFYAERVSAFGGYQWPYIEILLAFFELNPRQAAGYWRRMEERKEPFIGKSEVFDGMPFVGSNSDEVNELREMLVRNAKNDWELMTLAVAIARHERCDWAVEWVKRTLAEPESPGDIARAVTLAGLLDDSVVARDLWANELCEPPLGGWIEIVYSQAKQDIERAWDALYWLDRVFAAKTPPAYRSRDRIPAGARHELPRRRENLCRLAKAAALRPNAPGPARTGDRSGLARPASRYLPRSWPVRLENLAMQPAPARPGVFFAGLGGYSGNVDASKICITS